MKMVRVLLAQMDTSKLLTLATFWPLCAPIRVIRPVDDISRKWSFMLGLIDARSNRR